MGEGEQHVNITIDELEQGAAIPNHATTVTLLIDTNGDVQRAHPPARLRSNSCGSGRERMGSDGNEEARTLEVPTFR